MKVRSITLMLGKGPEPDLALRLVEAAKRAAPLTVRASLPPMERRAAAKAVEDLADMGYSYIAAMHFEEPHLLAEYVESLGVYAALRDIDAYLEFVGIIDRRGTPEHGKNVALALGPIVQSPYFPISVPSDTGVALSVLYPSDLRGRDVHGAVGAVYGEARSIGESVAREVGTPFLGVDMALSPWGDESVVDVVEELSGARFGGPGTYAAIAALNGAIRGDLGFNRVMLPLAEDNTLKRRVEEGAISPYAYALLSTACVVGFDMVPLDTDMATLRRLLLDMSAIAEAKGAMIGVRVFPAHGDYFHVPGFGKTPVLKL